MVEDLDFTTVDFEQEGDLVIDFIDYANDTEGTEVTVTDLVEDLAKSTVILPMAESMVANGEITVTVPEAQREEVLAAINNIQDAAKAETIKMILGLN